MKILNIYGQYDNHTEAKIIGNKEGLEALNRAILRALAYKAASTDEEKHTPLYASDGEGYEVIIEMHNGKWGLAGGKNSFWNKEESNPQYVMWMIQEAKQEELEPVALKDCWFSWLHFEKVKKEETNGNS